MKALILAGGKGLELLPITANTPKPMVPVGNIPFIFYQLDVLKKSGIKEVIISLTYQPRKIKDLLGDGTKYGMVIRYTNEPIPLGTAGAVKNAAHMIDKSVIVLNGDILTAIDISAVTESHYKKKALATIVYGTATKPERYGMVLHDKNRMVTGFIEKPKVHEIIDDHVNVGIYIFEKEILDFIPDQTYFTMERDLFPSLVSKNINLYAHKTTEYWLDIGDPLSYLQANMAVLSGKVPLPEFYGLEPKKEVKLPPTSRIDSKSFIDSGCIIKPGVEIENSVIGRNCRLEERVKIKDSVILPGTRIKRSAQLRYCVIGKNSVLGESIYINKGAVIGDKSIIADNSKF